MLKLLLHTLAWLLSRMPEWCLRLLSNGMGDLLYGFAPRRRRLMLSNLHHAFPDRTGPWRRQIARESARRLIETALLSLCTPCLREARLRKILRLTPETQTIVEAQSRNPTPTLLAAVHMAYWELQTVFPLLFHGPQPEIGVIFRPLKNPALNRWVTQSRERYGMRLLSRKEGFNGAMQILRRNGVVGMLFDQNAGERGVLTTFLGRVCSTTELPGLLAQKYQTRIIGVYVRRLGFWRGQLHIEEIVADGTSEGTTLALNRWLEDMLTRDDDLCASWLWSHDRWRTQDLPSRRLRLEAKRSLLDRTRADDGRGLPRKTRVWIRLPNWLGDVVLAAPLLKTLRASRPDAEITVLAKPQFLDLVQAWQLADRVLPLPPRGWKYFSFFHRLHDQYPDVYLLFTNSLRGDLEAWLTGCPQRFGILRSGKWRPFLTHGFRPAPDFDEAGHHQLELWRNFLRHFGLRGEPDTAPLLPRPPGAEGGPIGLIPGSENNPEKRWPVACWRTLIEKLGPAEKISLFGTAGDRPLADAIAEGFGSHIENLAGRTSLPEFCRRLAGCRLLITNDTGGMHLANALGVPLIALFGPTNPIRTGPVFAAPVMILQPAGCPATGGGVLAELTPDQVLAALKVFPAPSAGR